MKFNSFMITSLGLIFVGISIGYVMGYYIKDFSDKEYFSYFSVVSMGVGCFLTVYGSLFLKNKN